MDQSIHDLLARAIRVAEREYEEKRTYEAAQLVASMRQAAGCAEVYQAWLAVDAKP